MAKIDKDYPITDLAEDWEGHSGAHVQEFVKKKFKELGGKIDGGQEAVEVAHTSVIEQCLVSKSTATTNALRILADTSSNIAVYKIENNKEYGIDVPKSFKSASTVISFSNKLLIKGQYAEKTIEPEIIGNLNRVTATVKDSSYQYMLICYSNDAEMPKVTTLENGGGLSEDVRLVKQSVEELKDEVSKPISSDRTDFFEDIAGVNLYNKDKIVEGMDLKGYWGGDKFNSSSTYTITPPIYLSAGVQYKTPYDIRQFGSTAKFAKVTENGEYLSMGVNGEITDSMLLFTPSENGFYSFNIGTLSVDEFMVCEADKYPSSYEPYIQPMTDIPSIRESRLKDIREEIVKFAPNTKSILWHKEMVFDGDSICYGAQDDTGKHGWASRLCEKNGIDYNGRNYAVSGGTIATETYNSSSNPKHWISATIDTIIAEHPDIDYLIFEGGTNDADVIGESRLGTFNAEDFSGEYDSTTFFGALDTLFYKAINAYPTAKIGFIIAPKMSARVAKVGDSVRRRELFFENAMKACKKWGVPYLDLWHTSHLNPYLDSQYHNNTELSDSENNAKNKADGKLYADGQHPTSFGYEILTPIIERWMESL